MGFTFGSAALRIARSNSNTIARINRGRRNVFVVTQTPNSQKGKRLNSSSRNECEHSEIERIVAMTTAAKETVNNFPSWLQVELKTDHAGEFGAVEIYRGALLGARVRLYAGIGTDATKRMITFCDHHITTEQAHFQAMEALVPQHQRTKLLLLWRWAARGLGFFPALFGARSLYWTVMAVETFVEEHYTEQIQRLRCEKRREQDLPALLKLLESFCADEVAHRKEAVKALFGRDDLAPKELAPGPIICLWCAVVDLGSRAAVRASKLL
jgi:ubiquinone biosynthesis monooxygenase Coq7